MIMNKEIFPEVIRKQACYQIYGYIVGPHFIQQKPFEEAKKELIENLEYRIRCVQSISFDELVRAKKANFR